jgi:dihydropteroate synthase
MPARPTDALARRLLGERARALAPRVLQARRGPEARLRVAVRLEALAPQARSALAAAARAAERVPWDRPRHPAEGGLLVRRAALEQLAARLPDAALLLDAVQAALQPPRPPRLAGVVNVTPDSFSDGGRFLAPEAAVDHALALVEQGADQLDVGGESTRPGAQPVPAGEERARVVPVLAALAARTTVPLSVDTTKASVAEAALDAGATIVNDVSGGRADPAMLALAARRGCGLVLMHMRGTPRDMQRDPRYDEVVGDVLEELRERAAAAAAAGVDPARLWVDPGIGFGKTLEHNLALLRRLGELRSLGLPLYVGVSRKSFIGRINAAAGRGGEAAGERLGGTAAAVTACVLAGAELLRVHDVAACGEAARVAWALRGSVDGNPHVELGSAAG